jgi:hypothetical protein
MTHDASKHSGQDDESLHEKDVEHPDAPPTSSSVLNKEEQMAQFEEAMKNEDWGHQPC